MMTLAEKHRCQRLADAHKNVNHAMADLKTAQDYLGFAKKFKVKGEIKTCLMVMESYQRCMMSAERYMERAAKVFAVNGER